MCFHSLYSSIFSGHLYFINPPMLSSKSIQLFVQKLKNYTSQTGPLSPPSSPHQSIPPLRHNHEPDIPLTNQQRIHIQNSKDQQEEKREDVSKPTSIIRITHTPQQISPRNHVSSQIHFGGDFQVVTPSMDLKNAGVYISQSNILPPLPMINNLLTLSHLLNSNHLKSEMMRLSLKHQIPYIRILIVFCIEKMIEIFYNQHDVDLEINGQYVFQKIGSYLYQFFQFIHLNNWFILRRVLRGVLNRFGALKYYHDVWLDNLLKKKKTLFQSTGTNVCEILTTKQNFIKNRGQINVEEFIKNEQPLEKTDLIDYRRKYPQLHLEPDNSTELLHDPEQQKVVNKLRYFQSKKQQKKKHAKALKETAKHHNHNHDQYIEFEEEPALIQFQISIYKAQHPQNIQQIRDNQYGHHIKDKDQQQLTKKEKILLKIRNKRQQQSRNLSVAKKSTSICRKPPSSNKICKSVPNHDKQTGHLQSENNQRVSKGQPNEERQTNPNQHSILIEKISKIMEKQIYQFFCRNPDLTMNKLKRKMGDILVRHKVPIDLHDEITDKWFSKFTQ